MSIVWKFIQMLELFRRQNFQGLQLRKEKKYLRLHLYDIFFAFDMNVLVAVWPSILETANLCLCEINDNETL